MVPDGQMRAAVRITSYFYIVHPSTYFHILHLLPQTNSLLNLVLESNSLVDRTLNTSHNLLLSKDGRQRGPNDLRRLRSVNARPDTLGAVVVDNRSSLSVVSRQTLAEGLGVIVGTLDERLAGNVVSHGHLWWVELLVVGTTGSGVDQTTSDTRNEEGVIDLQLDRVIQLLLPLLEHGVQLVGLGDSTGETVEDEAELAFGVGGELGLDHADHDVVGDEASGVHDLLGLDTEGSLLGDLGAEHVTGSQVTDVELVLDSRGLGSLTYIPALANQLTSSTNCKMCAPAPGGPIKIMRSCSAGVKAWETFFPAACSSSSIRATRSATFCLKWAISSDIAVVVG
ncbi:hypothetical protein G7K_5985-t1 [Saitoella complicata NRRL Y-17804]|uniref:Uncharacterized protein n=1 Tax=Saitoella complicata (strain BCRC 22490 / CBS 7301 / JCM 7358 / NBRC 10748 / NRRL Y-17804) TaxID=698492 RepID=A0A0E9NPW0_SAICN|nr:hypothetical protein G7K_5985-t1 [Saitoella complicata NRRL Y-17804]